MLPLTMLGTDLAHLITTTTRVWWRLLPKILAVFLIGWLGYQVALELAILAGALNAWLALVVFSAGFIVKLGAIVLILRLVGAELGVRDLIPDDEQEEDDRDSSVSRLLALTLLPFLGIYAAFGQIQQAAAQLQVNSLFQNGGVLSEDDITAKLNVDSGSPRHYLTITAVVVGTYVLRRLVDRAHEETGWRPLGLLVAWIEGFFILSALIVGQGLVARVLGWFDDRAFMGWLAVAGAALHHAWLAATSVLPGFVLTAVQAVRDDFWPTLTQVVTQPIVWLAVAALVYGSSVISIAELWRRGEPLASRVRLMRRRLRRDERRSRPTWTANESGNGVPRSAQLPSLNGRVRFVTSEFKEAFLGDLDDKYLPTIQSLRLILRAGLVFIGAYLLVYNLLEVASNYWQTLLHHLIGGHPIAFWSTFGPAVDLLEQILTEPWRLCLLAVALRRALQIFRSRAERRGTLHPADRPRTAASVAAAHLAPGRPAVAGPTR